MRNPRLPLLVVLAIWGTCAFAQEPRTQPAISQVIDDLLAKPAAKRTSWGILATNVETGQVVYAHNADKLFVPASNVKLFATALALERLGPDYAYTTAVTADGAIDEEGTLSGDLVLVGGGDPNFSARMLPYLNKDRHGPDRLAPARHLARGVRDAGIRRITGDIVGDDSRYVWQPYPRGWSHADTLQGYGSAVSALVFNDNELYVIVRAGPAGAAARIATSPSLSFYTLANRTRTVPSGQVAVGLSARRGEEPGQVVIGGQISSDSRGRRFTLSTTDPARFAALALRRALTDLGIEVEGAARPRHLLPDRLPSLRSGRAGRNGSVKALAELQSSPLRQAVTVVNKISMNLHAEMLLREVGLREAGIGSQEAATRSLSRFLAEAGLRTGEYRLRDGSGLSRHNLLSPVGTVRLLEYMWKSASREAFVESLPLAGLDGTLDWRFRRTPARARIRAKTGSMTHVTALSGYAESDHGTYAFSIFANNFGLASSSTRHLLDSIAASLVTAPPD